MKLQKNRKDDTKNVRGRKKRKVEVETERLEEGTNEGKKAWVANGD